MRKYLKKALWGVVMTCTLAGTVAMGSAITSNHSAAPETQQTAISQEVPDNSTTLYAEKTAVKYTYYYRVHNGWIQRRLFNRTYGCWAESKWHNVKRAS